MKYIAVLFSACFLVWVGSRVANYIVYIQDCEGYIKRAADSNTVELAAKNLKVAVDYLEAEGWTKGYTSVIYRTPDEDVGFWYDNLKASLEELRGIKPEAAQLERTNVLMKLRETLLDEGQSVSITAPAGITVFPNNTAYAALGVLFSILTVATWVVAAVVDD